MNDAQTAADELAELANTFKLASEKALDGETREVSDARIELVNLNENKIGKIILAVNEAMGKKTTEETTVETAEKTTVENAEKTTVENAETTTEKTAGGGGRRRTRSARRGKRRAKSRRRRYYY